MHTPIPQIRPGQLEAWAAAVQAAAPGQALVLLDVREPWEVQTASAQAPDFTRIAIPMSALPQRLAELDPEQAVACLCHHGARSQRVALFLQQHGFEQVANIAGGIDAWSRERDATIPLY
jgi:rhodanese-related sulfurtransferase